MNIISASDGKCTAEMTVLKEHTNSYGTLHGGFTAFAVDTISSMAILTHPKVVHNLENIPNSGVSVDIHVSYVFEHIIKI